MLGNVEALVFCGRVIDKMLGNEALVPHEVPVKPLIHPSIHRSIDPSNASDSSQALGNQPSTGVLEGPNAGKQSIAFQKIRSICLIYKIQYRRRVLNVSKTADIGPQKFNDMSA